MSLARWLLESHVEHRWDIYIHVLKERAQQGGHIYLGDNLPDERWLSSCAADWSREGKTLGLTFLQGLHNQQENHKQRLSPDQLLRFVGEDSWLSPAGEGLNVCLSCREHEIISWIRAAEKRACPACNSDTFRLLPTRLHPSAKEAIQKGVLLELVAAEAISKVGAVFGMATPNGRHRSGIPFEHTLVPIEVDAIGEIGETLVIIECKDLAVNNTLNIGTLDQAASKLHRLIETLSPCISTNYTKSEIVFVTTGRLDPTLKTKTHQLSGIHCRVLDRADLVDVLQRLAKPSDS